MSYAELKLPSLAEQIARWDRTAARLDEAANVAYAAWLALSSEEQKAAYVAELAKFDAEADAADRAGDTAKASRFRPRRELVRPFAEGLVGEDGAALYVLTLSAFDAVRATAAAEGDTQTASAYYEGMAFGLASRRLFA